MVKMSWLNDKHVQNWFENLKSERTVQNYKERFPRFLEWCKKTPTEIIKSRLEHLTTQDLEKRRYWESRLIKFTRYLESLKDSEGKRTLSTWSIKGYQTCVQSFFSHNGVKLVFARKELDVEPAERETVEKEWIPSNEEVRMIYRACKNARDRSIVLLLYQSGFSEVDVSNMRIEDFDFYDQNGNWQMKPYEDVYHARLREKTNILQQSCVSREAIEDIRISLQDRGFPRKGFLFTSAKGRQFTPRFINDMLKSIVEHHLSYKQAEWKTKHLRDSYMNGLLMAKVTQELKDAMVGHKRKGARASYGIAEQTVRQAYDSAFRFLTVNGVGSSTRKIDALIEKQKQDTLALTGQIIELREALIKATSKAEKRKEFLDMLDETGILDKLLEPIAKKHGVTIEQWKRDFRKAGKKVRV
jgi:integrase